ncbi:hypothetical protein [Achromobacter xylosoxidans]|uniref:hypothetical protein n=1 Tax=Alcaligenes xylosoxydans xylosoxydans TaxID=85698 RepID=UPI001F13E73F|nr:hypothetical protein [Achromobacter xylosoxidans]
MNTISASAPPARIRPRRTVAKAARNLGGLISPRDHAGKGNWSKDADIPFWAWPGGLALAAFLLCGQQVLRWLVSP